MREILFRGKRADNGEWVYGWYCMYMFDGEWPPEHAIIPWADAMGGYYHHIHREVDIETVGQFTGFYDKEGAKIFEGDIITDDMNREWVSAVFFRFGEFKVNPHPAGTYLWELDADDRIVFLGNIYDHPELLEV